MSVSIPLYKLSLFRNYKSRVIANIRTSLDRLSIKSDSQDQILKYIEKPSCSIDFECGEATIYSYILSNGEHKIFAHFSDSNFTTLDPYWLPYYPFIKSDANSTFSINQSLFSFSGKLSSFTQLVSHNNHFGHFIGDDLLFYSSRLSPLLLGRAFSALDLRPMASHRLSIPFSQAQPLQSFDLTKSSCYFCPNFLSYTLANPIALFFIKSVPSTQTAYLSQDNKYIILREGNFKSRISNKSEILSHATESDSFL